MENRFWLICYDVRDERRLHRIAKLMEKYGRRKQKSVFECWVSDEILTDLKAATTKIIDAAKDSIKFYTLCKDCRELSESKGGTAIEEIQQFYIA